MEKCKAITGSAVKGLSDFVTTQIKLFPSGTQTCVLLFLTPQLKLWKSLKVKWHTWLNYINMWLEVFQL